MNTATYLKSSSLRVSNAVGTVPTNNWEEKYLAWNTIQNDSGTVIEFNTNDTSLNFYAQAYTTNQLGAATISEGTTSTWSSSSLIGQTLKEGMNTFDGVLFEKTGATENEFTCTVEIRTTTVTCYLPPSESMKLSRMPAQDGKLLQWGLAWTKEVPEDSDINQSWLDFATAYQAQQNPKTKSKTSAAALKTARENFTAACRREICPEGVGGSTKKKPTKAKEPADKNEYPSDPKPKLKGPGIVDYGSPKKLKVSGRKWLFIELSDDETGDIVHEFEATKFPIKDDLSEAGEYLRGKALRVRWRWEGTQNGTAWVGVWSAYVNFTVP